MYIPHIAVPSSIFNEIPKDSKDLLSSSTNVLFTGRGCLIHLGAPFGSCFKIVPPLEVIEIGIDPGHRDDHMKLLVDLADNIIPGDRPVEAGEYERF